MSGVPSGMGSARWRSGRLCYKLGSFSLLDCFLIGAVWGGDSLGVCFGGGGARLVWEIDVGEGERDNR